MAGIPTLASIDLPTAGDDGDKTSTGSTITKTGGYEDMTGGARPRVGGYIDMTGGR